jgi:glycyl-tRNA synthetase alpha subunit
MMRRKKLQQIILALEQFRDRHSCVLQQPCDVEVGADTMAPEMSLRVLGPEPYRIAYVMPSRRLVDGRYGDNPNRVQKQHQVILKTASRNIQDIYLKSLAALGIILRKWDLPEIASMPFLQRVLMIRRMHLRDYGYGKNCGTSPIFYRGHPISSG